MTKRLLTAAVFVFLVGLFLRLYLIFTLPLWFDETVAIQIINRGFATIAMHSTDVARPPLYYMILKTWSYVSTQYVWLRTLTLLCYVLNFFIWIRIGKKFYSPVFGLFLAGSYAFSGYFLIFDWQIKGYTMLLSAILLTLMFSFDRKPHAVPVLLCVLTGLFLDYGYLYVVLPLILFSGYRAVGEGTRENRLLFLSVLLAFCIFSPYLYVLGHNWHLFITGTRWVSRFSGYDFTIPFLFGVSAFRQGVILSAPLWIAGTVDSMRRRPLFSTGTFLLVACLISYTGALAITAIFVPVLHVRSLQIVAASFLFGIAFFIFELFLQGKLYRLLSYGLMTALFVNGLYVCFLMPVSPDAFLVSFN